MNAKKTFSALAGALLLAAGSAALADGNGGDRTAMDVPVGSLPNNQGALMCVAAINSTGTVAGGSGPYVASAANLGTGSYEVLFKGPCGSNITASKGWARWVQVDTLTTGSISGVSCTTADRAGSANGVWVYCTDGAGAPVNTSFFMFVAR